MKQKTIIFDVMNGDNPLAVPIKAIESFLKTNNDYKIIIVGKKEEILLHIKENEQVQIYDSRNVVSKEKENILTSHKEKNSLNDALHLLKEGKGQAVLSSANSAKFLIGSMFICKRIEGVSRPAFMSIIPTINENKKFLLLDEGANLITNSKDLIQWAKLGIVFSKEVLNIQKPNVGILNIGTEKDKGFEFQQEANKYILDNQNTFLNNYDFNYLSFIEPRELLEGNIDVVVADGYAGNIVLKTMEGTVLTFTKLIKQKLFQNTWRKIGALILKNAFSEIKEQLDYRNVGAAWILGIDGIVIKAHGSSDEKAYLGALNQIKLAIESNALDKFKGAINKDEKNAKIQ